MEKTTLLVALGNMNQFTFPDQNYSSNENNIQGSNYTYNQYKEICITAFYSVFCFLGIIGNGLVIWIGIFRMKKTVNVVWFLSLAVADFSFTIFCPLLLTQFVLGFWLFKNTLCKLFMYVLHINSLTSILQITVISVDRCICVVFPVWCHNHRRPRLAFIIVLMIWIISLAAATPSIIYTNIYHKYNRTMCRFSTSDSSFKNRIILDFVFFFLLPFIIIVSCYIVIASHIRRKHTLASSRLLKTSLAVIIAFFICWFPSRLFLLFAAFERNKFDDFAVYYGTLSVKLLIVISTCINPILYVFIGRDFKEKFCTSFQAKLEKAFMEEEKAVSEKQERSTALQSLHQDYKEEEEIIG